jgi:hypothetical protein
LLILPFFLLWMPGGSLSFGFSSLCNRYHLCAHYAHSKLAVVPVASSEQILQQRDSLPHVSTGMSLTRSGMPVHHQSPSVKSLFDLLHVSKGKRRSC